MAEPLRIAISAGELSGDEHGAALARALRACSPDVSLRGMGGKNLRDANVTTDVDCEKSGALMGFYEVFRGFANVFRAMREMKKLLREWRPHLLILIDYPDFNLRLAAYAKKLGIPVFYYIPPKVWVWRAHRVKKLIALVDRIALVFPHERAFLESRGYHRASYVGHPFVDTLAARVGADGAARTRARQALGIEEDRCAVALFPGSRKSEVARNLKNMLDGFRLLKKKIPDLCGIIPLPATLKKDSISTQIRPDDDISITDGRSLDVLRACDVGLLKSGTSNLQAAFVGLPFVMFFIPPRVGAAILRVLTYINEFSPVNIVRPHTVVELIQGQASPQNIASHLEDLLLNKEKREALQQGLADVVKKLSSYDREPGFEKCHTSYERVAEMVLQEVARSAGH